MGYGRILGLFLSGCVVCSAGVPAVAQDENQAPAAAAAPAEPTPPTSPTPPSLPERPVAPSVPEPEAPLPVAAPEVPEPDAPETPAPAAPMPAEVPAAAPAAPAEAVPVPEQPMTPAVPAVPEVETGMTAPVSAAAPAPEATAEARAPFLRQLPEEGTLLGALLFPNSDFEQGTLENWRLEGPAFERQPTKGDNVNVREPKRHSLHAGEYWLGTFERYTGGAGEKPGTSQGDQLTGGLISESFVISEPYITFLIGGSRERGCSVKLVVEGTAMLETQGARAEEMRRVWWDVREWVGRKALLYLTDHETGAWGHLNADDFRYARELPDTRLFPNSDFETGTLENWTGEGTAFEFQPTKGDNAAIRTKNRQRSLPAGEYWIGTYEKYQGHADQTPGGEVGNAATGRLLSIPFVIAGRQIVCRVGGGKSKEVGVKLLVDGEVVRVVRGSDSATMGLAVIDVSELKGRTAQIEIEDKATGRYGIINADDFHYGRF